MITVPAGGSIHHNLIEAIYSFHSGQDYEITIGTVLTAFVREREAHLFPRRPHGFASSSRLLSGSPELKEPVVLFPLDEKPASRRSRRSKRVRRKGHHANSLLIMAYNVQLQCRGEGRVG
jgi:hypothetical protein